MKPSTKTQMRMCLTLSSLVLFCLYTYITMTIIINNYQSTTANLHKEYLLSLTGTVLNALIVCVARSSKVELLQKVYIICIACNGVVTIYLVGLLLKLSRTYAGEEYVRKGDVLLFVFVSAFLTLQTILAAGMKSTMDHLHYEKEVESIIAADVEIEEKKPTYRVFDKYRIALNGRTFSNSSRLLDIPTKSEGFASISIA